MCVWEGYVHMSAGVYGGHKLVPEFPELELQSVMSHLMWVLGTELESSVRPVHTLNY